MNSKKLLILAILGGVAYLIYTKTAGATATSGSSGSSSGAGLVPVAPKQPLSYYQGLVTTYNATWQQNATSYTGQQLIDQQEIAYNTLLEGLNPGLANGDLSQTAYGQLISTATH